MAFLCSASLTEKVDFAHSLFDFGLQGDLSLPEVTILLRTVLIACSKVSVPPLPFVTVVGVICVVCGGGDGAALLLLLLILITG